MILHDEREEILSGELPEELYRVYGGVKIAHIDDECQSIRGDGGRWWPKEYLKRAGNIRLCRDCGDGRALGGEL